MRDVFVCSVLGGAYRGRQEDRRMVTHALFGERSPDGRAFDVPNDITKTFCGYPTGSLVDPFWCEPLGAAPTCPKCREKFDKYLSSQPVRFPKGAS